MDPSTFEVRASKILTGLGFDKKTIHKKTKDMSGGWRMRVALAKALFVKPSLLLLDDPTGMFNNSRNKLHRLTLLSPFGSRGLRVARGVPRQVAKNPRLGFPLPRFLERCLHKHDRHARQEAHVLRR